MCKHVYKQQHIEGLHVKVQVYLSFSRVFGLDIPYLNTVLKWKTLNSFLFKNSKLIHLILFFLSKVRSLNVDPVLRSCAICIGTGTILIGAICIGTGTILIGAVYFSTIFCIFCGTFCTENYITPTPVFRIRIQIGSGFRGSSGSGSGSRGL